MDYPKIICVEGQSSRLVLPVCISPDADVVVEQSGHTPNGYFWAGVAEWLLRGPLSDHRADFDFDPEGVCHAHCIIGFCKSSNKKIQ